MLFDILSVAHSRISSVSVHVDHGMDLKVYRLIGMQTTTLSVSKFYPRRSTIR